MIRLDSTQQAMCLNTRIPRGLWLMGTAHFTTCVECNDNAMIKHVKGHRMANLINHIRSHHKDNTKPGSNSRQKKGSQFMKKPVSKDDETLIADKGVDGPFKVDNWSPSYTISYTISSTISYAISYTISYAISSTGDNCYFLSLCLFKYRLVMNPTIRGIKLSAMD